MLFHLHRDAHQSAIKDSRHRHRKAKFNDGHKGTLLIRNINGQKDSVGDDGEGNHGGDDGGGGGDGSKMASGALSLLSSLDLMM